MQRDEIQAALERVKAALHQQFEDEVDTHGARLQQLDHALATASMAAESLFDEEEREVELAVRIVNREKVHGDNEAVSPTGGRTVKQYAIVAGRAN